MTHVLTVKPKRGEYVIRIEAIRSVAEWCNASPFRFARVRRNEKGVAFAVWLYDSTDQQRQRAAALWSMPTVGSA